MQNKALKIGLTTTVLVAAFVGLLWTTMADGTAYSEHADEVMVDPEPWYGTRLQVHRYAKDIRIRQKRSTHSNAPSCRMALCSVASASPGSSCRVPS